MKKSTSVYSASDTSGTQNILTRLSSSVKKYKILFLIALISILLTLPSLFPLLTDRHSAREIKDSLRSDVDAPEDLPVTANVAIKDPYERISGYVKKGETLYNIFEKHNLSIKQLYGIVNASKKIFNLGAIKPGMTYKILTDAVSKDILEFKYAMDSSSHLFVKKEDKKYVAKKIKLENKSLPGLISGAIKTSLIEAIGTDREHLNVTFDLADILAWDIDFSTDLRKGDEFRIIVEELYRDNIFLGYGDILYARFVNNGKQYEAFGYALSGKREYFTSSGKSFRKALLRAPLKFRYISSSFTHKRKHPILKIYRPHLGVDYAAPKGTPVSAAGDGTVTWAAYKGQNGKLVVIKHLNGYKTYYGHLSRYAKGIKKGKKVKQGQIIGYVGSTGLSTGPHLDYRVKLNNKSINPLKMKLPSSTPVPKKHKEEFNRHVEDMRRLLAELSVR